MRPFDLGAPRIYFGEGVSQQTPAYLAQLGGIENVMVIFDQGIKAVGIADPIVKSIADAGYKVTTYDELHQDPDGDLVDKIAGIAKEQGVQAVVAIGGGGVLDVAQTVAVMITNEGKLMDYKREVGMPGKDFANMGAPWIGIPTTAGTGAECTHMSLITDPVDQRKVMIGDKVRMMAKAAYLDPAIVAGLPKGLTASTGMDALSHAIESYLTFVANGYTEVYSMDAVKRIMKWLPISVADGSNLEARGEMLLAAAEAGIAFGNSALQIGHAISHGTGAAIHVPHGIACAWGLRYAIRRSGETAPMWKLQTLAEAMGIVTLGKERAQLTAEIEGVVAKMNADFGIPTPRTFKDGAIADKSFMEKSCEKVLTAEKVMLSLGGGVPFAVKVTPEELHAFFEEMWTEW